MHTNLNKLNFMERLLLLVLITVIISYPNQAKAISFDDVTVSTVYVKEDTSVQDPTGSYNVGKVYRGDYLIGISEHRDSDYYIFLLRGRTEARIPKSKITNKVIYYTAYVNSNNVYGSYLDTVETVNLPKGHAYLGRSFDGFFFTKIDNRDVLVPQDKLSRPPIIVSAVAKNNVNIRNSKNHIIGKATTDDFFKGYVMGNYFHTTYKGQKVKIHSKFLLIQEDVTDVFIKSNTNIRTGSGQFVKKAYKGEKYNGYILGDYFFIRNGHITPTFHSNNNKVHRNFVSLKPIYIDMYTYDYSYLHRFNGGGIIHETNRGDYYKGYIDDNYFITQYKDTRVRATLSEWSRSPIKISTYAKRPVNIRSLNTNKVIGKAKNNQSFKGFYKGDYFQTTYKGQKVKIHKNFLVSENVETKIKVNKNVAIRYGSDNSFYEMAPRGKTLNGYFSGDYFYIDGSFKKVHKNYVKVL